MAKKNSSRVKKHLTADISTERSADRTHSGLRELNGKLEIGIDLVNGVASISKFNFRQDANLRGSSSGNHASITDEHERKTEGIEQEDYFFIRENKILHKLCLGDILFIQAMGDYVSIFKTDKKITIHHNLKALESKLPENKFLRIHRSYMVSINKIEAIEEGTVYIGSHPIPIGEAYKSKLMKLIKIIK